MRREPEVSPDASVRQELPTGTAGSGPLAGRRTKVRIGSDIHVRRCQREKTQAEIQRTGLDQRAAVRPLYSNR
jgi:hypothetical protein